jgi:hemoglobin
LRYFSAIAKIKQTINAKRSLLMEKHKTPYEIIGEEKLSMLVDAFYARVGKEPLLTPIFPDDLSETARKQKQFLTQYLGGPPLYTEEHGHPMMRARHLNFEITPTRAKAWLRCMSEAMDEIGLEGHFRDEFFSRLVLTARHMVNTPDTVQGEESEQHE